MNQVVRFWEKGYSDHSVWAMGGPSIEVNEIECYLPRNSAVLDIGCGDGRNSVFLALRGHKVTALEMSPNAVKKLRTIADQLSLDIQVIEGRIEDFNPDHTYDLVLAHSSLHFVEKKVWIPLLKKLRDLTKNGGFHNFTSIIGTKEYPIPHECRHANSFERGDLDNIYSDWEIIRSNFYAKWDSHPGIPMHVHVVEKFVARKASSEENIQFIKTEYDNVQSISSEIFHNIPMNVSQANIRAMRISPTAVHRTDIHGIKFESQKAEVETYVVEDWIFKGYGLQFTRGSLSGKYHYFTKPFYLKCI